MGERMAKTTRVIAGVLMMLFNGIAAKTLIVGDDNGWRLPSSPSFYNDWAVQQSFAVDDILVFNFPTGAHTVASVSKDAYDQCDATLDVDAVITIQGPFEKTLDNSGQFFFLCTIGNHCSRGLKLAVNVSTTVASNSGAALAQSPGPALAPSPGPDAAPAPESG